MGALMQEVNRLLERDLEHATNLLTAIDRRIELLMNSKSQGEATEISILFLQQEQEKVTDYIYKISAMMEDIEEE
jgi:hypothetical protein